MMHSKMLPHRVVPSVTAEYGCCCYCAQFSVQQSVSALYNLIVSKCKAQNKRISCPISVMKGL